MIHSGQFTLVINQPEGESSFPEPERKTIFFHAISISAATEEMPNLSYLSPRNDSRCNESCIVLVRSSLSTFP